MRIPTPLLICFLPRLLYSIEGVETIHPETGIRIVTATVELPAEGRWYVDQADNFQNPVGYTYLAEPGDAREPAGGARARALQLRKQQRERSRVLWRIQWNRRPQREKDDRRRDLPADLDWVHIREGVRAAGWDQETPEVLALETAPLADDGTHWILWSNGRRERVEIDAGRWRAEGIVVEPELFATEPPGTLRYTLYAHLRNPDVRRIDLTLKNDETASSRDVSIAIGGEEGGPEAFTAWAESRAWSWADLDNRIADIWLSRASALYGLDPKTVGASQGPGRGNTNDMLGVLGGGAAIRETLQMQNIDAGENTADGADVPVSDIQGVTVRAHDYAELLGDADGVTVELANLCPPDRFWLYAPDPAALEPLLDGGAEWMGAFRGGLTGRMTDQQVLERHLARLGLDENTLRMVLRTGILGETAVILPDLFLLEGTDVTCVARVRDLQAVGALFQARGIGPSPDPQTYRARDGHQVTWAMRDDLLFIGSHPDEVDKVLALHDQNGKGGLGKLAEFRYMLTQCGPGPDTRVFAYLSDPFIRRLTGPAVKIAQHRRLRARADLERLHAGALLHRQDTGEAAESLETLLESKYVAPLSLVKPEDLAFDQGVATHPDWGRVGRMPTLLDNMPESATSLEAAAYKEYRQRYERFWRQFFDPIAVNLESPGPETYRAEIFVLPLINSSIYDRLRQVLSTDGPVKPLARPAITPAPIAMLSLNPGEDAWLDMIEGLSDLFTDSLGVDLPVWEHLGPGLHLGIADSDSILTFGTGGLAGLFSSNRTPRGTDMMMIPMVASLFTRPTVLAVELDQPDVALEKMRRMRTGSGWKTGWGGFKVNLTRIAGRDRWLLRFSMEELLFLTFSLEVQDGYLVVSNLPMTYRPRVEGRLDPSLHHAAARFDPAAAEQTRRAFAVAALDRARDGAYKGLGVLHAFHWSGVSTLEDALAQCATLFGFAPVHPAPGRFVDTPEGPESDTFGHLFEGRQPELEDIDEPFGLFPVLQKLDVAMQLEHEGFRGRITWKLAEKEEKN